MSEENPTSSTEQSQTNAEQTEIETAIAALSTHPQHVVQPPSSQSVESAATFMEVYDCTKLNSNWNKVSNSLAIHPDWLIRIPEGRRWTMLHQIVFSGDVMHLNEVLALQANNPNFRLLCKTLDDKTVREVAAERAHVHPQMLRRIERLVSVDQLLNNARDRKWELVKQCIRSQPDIVNEKPPYRRFYLAHHLALVGDLNMFKELSNICQFKLDLLAENKTISQVAREHNHPEFADYIDSLTTASNQTTENEDDSTDPTFPAGEHHYSPGFYEDVGISFIPANLDLNNLFPTTTTSFHFNNNHYYNHHSPHHHSHYQTNYGHNPAILTTIMPIDSVEQNNIQEEEQQVNDNNNHQHQATSTQAKSDIPQMTDEEQAAYEQTIKENIQKLSQQNLLSSITCCITKNILHDPVVAADGFTYEREAILNWFKESNRSPMTNEELNTLDLKPNYAIKSILQLLQQGNTSS